MQTPNMLAIDPGKSGGIAWFKNSIAHAQPMPLAGKELDGGQIAAIVQDIGPVLVILEKQAYVPLINKAAKGKAREGRQSGVSTFTTGMNYGVLQGILMGLQVPFEIVTPQKWKGQVLAGTGKDKDAAIAYCRRVFPQVNLIPGRCRTPQDGLADALCILEYGRREFAGQVFVERVKAKRAS